MIADTAYNGGIYFYDNSINTYSINNRRWATPQRDLSGRRVASLFQRLAATGTPGVGLSQRHVYIAAASHGDNGPYHGWLLRYDVTGASPARTGVLNTTPNGGLGGIWQAGGTPIFDAAGQHLR